MFFIGIYDVVLYFLWCVAVFEYMLLAGVFAVFRSVAAVFIYYCVILFMFTYNTAVLLTGRVCVHCSSVGLKFEQ